LVSTEEVVIFIWSPALLISPNLIFN